MASDPTDDTDRFTDLVGTIYDAVLDPELWPAVLESACVYVGGTAANIFWQDAADRSAIVFHSFGEDPAYTASYHATYAPLNPMFPAMTFVEPGRVVSGGDLVPHDEFRATRFFKEWVEPQGLVDVVGANIQRYPTSSACFAIRRSAAQGVVDAQARRRAELITPHVRRAVMIGREIDRQRARSAALEAVLGGVSAAVFLVDAGGRLVLANEPGRALLDRGAVLAERNGALVAPDPRAQRALGEAVAAAAEGRDAALGRQGVAIPLPDGKGPPWLAHLLPLASGARAGRSLGYAAVAALFVRRAELPVASGIETIARVYGLTPSEIRVLQASVARGGVGEVAEALGLSAATVKTHLSALFAKTGARRQADLVRAVAAHGNPLA